MDRARFIPGGTPNRRRRVDGPEKTLFETEEELRKQYPQASLWEYLADMEGNLRQGKGVFIGGPLGAGKTTLLVNLLHWASAHFTSHLYAPMGRLMLVLEHKSEESLAPFMYAGVLAIDDLDEVPDALWIQRRFRTMIQQRVDMRLPTMAATTLGKSPLQKLIGEKTYEILRRSSAVVFVGGKS